jgi:hypothetical protein
MYPRELNLSAYPIGDKLKFLDLSYVAEELEKHGKLGKA